MDAPPECQSFLFGSQRKGGAESEINILPTERGSRLLTSWDHKSPGIICFSTSCTLSPTLHTTCPQLKVTDGQHRAP